LSACFLIQNLAEIGQLVDELWPNSDFQDGGRCQINFKKNYFLLSRDCNRVQYLLYIGVANFIKIRDFFTEIWRFKNFQNGGRPPFSILKICNFCHVALVNMLFCCLTQKFSEIGQSVDELRPKKRFSRWRPPF